MEEDSSREEALETGRESSQPRVRDLQNWISKCGILARQDCSEARSLCYLDQLAPPKGNVLVGGSGIQRRIMSNGTNPES
jgi:hypothetical protein